MQYQRFDHSLTLNMTSEMRDGIDRALVLVQDTLIRTRSEFIRAACQFALDSLANGCGDVPVSVEERQVRVLSGAVELETDRSAEVPAKSGSHPATHSASVIDVG
jgi:hypothetical protein